MKKRDYEKFERELRELWERTPNLDNDPITAGQKRAGAISAALAVFFEKELDDPSTPAMNAVQILAAITANTLLGIQSRVSSSDGPPSDEDKAEVLTIFINTLFGYNAEMIGAVESAGRTKTGGVVRIEEIDVGDA